MFEILLPQSGLQNEFLPLQALKDILLVPMISLRRYILGGLHHLSYIISNITVKRVSVECILHLRYFCHYHSKLYVVEMHPFPSTVPIAHPFLFSNLLPTKYTYRIRQVLSM